MKHIKTLESVELAIAKSAESRNLPRIDTTRVLFMPRLASATTAAVVIMPLRITTVLSGTAEAAPKKCAAISSASPRRTAESKPLTTTNAPSRSSNRALEAGDRQ